MLGSIFALEKVFKSTPSTIQALTGRGFVPVFGGIERYC